MPVCYWEYENNPKGSGGRRGRLEALHIEREGEMKDEENKAPSFPLRSIFVYPTARIQHFNGLNIPFIMQNRTVYYS